MSSSVKGEISWTGSRDEEGHREFTLVTLVKTTSANDGPYVVMNTPGLPAIGAVWNIGNDNDTSCYCWPDMKIQRHPDEPEEEPGYWWTVEQKFSTKPIRRCQEASIGNPLLEPMKIGGSFVKYVEEARADRYGKPIMNSALEIYKGKIVERDFNRPTVWVEMNLGSLPLGNMSLMMDGVNDNTLWGLAAHCVKLSNCTWERKYYGQCSVYYSVRYEFDIDFRTFKRAIIDEGTRCLAPGGTKTNQRHFRVFRGGEKGDDDPQRVLLDGDGGVLTDTTTPYIWTKELYTPRNLLLLGIPTTL